MGKVFEQYKKYVIQDLKDYANDYFTDEDVEREKIMDIIELIPNCKDMEDIKHAYGDLFSETWEEIGIFDFINNY